MEGTLFVLSTLDKYQAIVIVRGAGKFGRKWTSELLERNKRILLRSHCPHLNWACKKCNTATREHIKGVSCPWVETRLTLLGWQTESVEIVSGNHAPISFNPLQSESAGDNVLNKQ